MPTKVIVCGPIGVAEEVMMLHVMVEIEVIENEESLELVVNDELPRGELREVRTPYGSPDTERLTF